jgi:hypothetical protein
VSWIWILHTFLPWHSPFSFKTRSKSLRSIVQHLEGLVPVARNTQKNNLQPWKLVHDHIYWPYWK